MKKLIMLIIALVFNIYAQEFTVDKISGNVSVMRGTDEEWNPIKVGQKLNKNDLISTSDKSFIQLSNKDGRFLLKANAALNLGAVKKITLNELLLALAAEEIRNVPNKKRNSNLNNTAVYGKEESANKKNPPLAKELGIKKINGARQLAESGYRESALIVAKETFRKYPDTKNNFENRLYFVDLMLDLKLKNEAMADLSEMKTSKPSGMQLNELDTRLARIKNETSKN